MFLVGLISWWYGHGWMGQLRRSLHRWSATVGVFSIGALLASLFAPFRQISAGSAQGAPVGAAIRAFFDQLISRIIGAIVRTVTILAGIVVIILQVVYESIVIVMWLLLPLFPVVGFILFATGWVPSW